MIRLVLHGLAQIAADWHSEPLCKYCETKCRSCCAAARRIAALEWELEVAQTTVAQLSRDRAESRETVISTVGNHPKPQ